MNQKSRSDEVANALVSECQRRLFDDSLPRLRKCLWALSEDEIWSRPNAETTSVGNLVLHLCGNIRQWIISGLGGAPDVRERDLEFGEPGPMPIDKLLRQLDGTMREVQVVLTGLDLGSLLEEKSVQGRRESGVGILLHVVEHFSYHVGQITYYVKSRKSVDLGYFKGIDLNKKNA